MYFVFPTKLLLFCRPSLSALECYKQNNIISSSLVHLIVLDLFSFSFSFSKQNALNFVVRVSKVYDL